MTNVDIIIHGDYVITMNDNMDLIYEGAIAIKDTNIIKVGTAKDIKRDFTSKTIIDGKGKAVLPGLINTHTHAAMVYFRGLADDLLLKDWLENHMWPAENAFLSPEFISDATELACLEMIKAGVTTYNDMYFFCESAAKSTIKAGMRAVLGVGILDFPSVSANNKDEYFANAQRMIDQYKGHKLITPCVAPHTIYTCGKETLKDAKNLAEKYDLPIHIHLSETEWEAGESIKRYGMRPVKFLDSIGFLSEKVVSAHCVWLDEEEIDIMAKSNASVSHCIESNMKLASGFAPIVNMINKGLNVSIGTDGAASNNDLSLLGEISTVAKVHKALSKDPTAMNDKLALTMGTKNGAKALGMSHLIGTIEEGKEADIISINLKKPHLTPIYDIYSHIVYAAMGSDIDTVIIRGNIIMDNGYVLTLDEDEIFDKAEYWAKKIEKFK